jgi:hypothetical protein
MRILKAISIITLIIVLTSCGEGKNIYYTPTATIKPRRTGLPTYTNSPIIHDQIIVPVLCTLKNRPAQRSYHSNTPILFSWGWEAKTEEQIYEFIENNKTIITLDDIVISDGLYYEIRKKAGEELYEVIWARDVGILSIGKHKLIYNVNILKLISDGINVFGPGTDMENLRDECVINIY